jgi:hypothetical protein
MSHIAADLAQAVHQNSDAVQHPIERSRQPVQVVARTAHWHAAREVPADDRLRRTGNRIHALEEGSAKQGASTNAKHRRQADGPEKSCGDGLLKVGDLAHIATDRQQHATAHVGNQGADPLGAATILGGLRHVDHRPTRLQAHNCRHLAREMRAVRPSHAIVKRTDALPASADHVQHV